MSDVLFGTRGEGAFAAAFATKIAPRLAALDEVRRKNLGIWLAIMGGAAALALLLAVLMWRGGAGLLPIVLLAAVPPVLGWHAAQYPERAWRTAVLAEVMGPVCGFVGDLAFAREPAPGIAPEPLAALGLLPAHDRVQQEDEFHGRYRNTAFRMVEMTLKRTERRGKRRKTRTVFQGLVLQLAVPVRFEGRVLVGREAGLLGRPFADHDAALRGLAPIAPDDPAFEAMFSVYTDNPDIARMLLTATVRATLAAFVEAHGKAGLRAAFADGSFTLAATTGPLFEPGSLFRPAPTLEEDVKRLLRDATIPHRLIDNLLGTPSKPVVQPQA